MTRFLSILAALYMACLSTQASAATLVTDGGGFLTGANGVAFDGASYDVSFLDVNCGVDNCEAPFLNDGSPSSVGAFAQAMLDQVFAAGSFFDLNTQLIRGCEGNFGQCQIHMRGLGVIHGVRATVVAGAAATNVVSNVSTIGHDTTPLNYQSIALVNLSTPSEVPLPASLPLLAGGLGLIAALRRRRKA